MWDVVFTRVPAPGEDERDAFVHRMDHYVLGPAPYGKNIVPDETRDQITTRWKGYLEKYGYGASGAGDR